MIQILIAMHVTPICVLIFCVSDKPFFSYSVGSKQYFLRANVCSQILSNLDICTPSEIELDWVAWHQNWIWELFEIFQQAFRICLNISFISKNMATRLCWKLVSKKLFRVKYQTFGPFLEWNFRLLTVMPDFGPEGVIAGHCLIVGVWLYY